MAARKKKATGRVFRFEACGFDVFDPHPGTPDNGTLVRKTQPYGCPRNGTMGHCYVEDAETGEFCGLVQVSSLVPVDGRDRRGRFATEEQVQPPSPFTVVTGSPGSIARKDH
jgi:hypothetical protein